MSTYFYLACHSCSELSPAVSKTAGGYCPLGDSKDTLPPFILSHHGCERVTIMKEGEISFDEWKEWDEENMSEMIKGSDAK